ncbi:hypothetical protein [Caballeronia glathei]|uniref:hypothetical protein n=1 Tax=Caballeronia glathei TaxID=60547 RepID=UPI000A6A4586|nr:hypothetical protein [Caballeronia glathei]
MVAAIPDAAARFTEDQDLRPSILRNCNPEPAIDSRRMRGAGDGALKHGAYARYMQNTP